jgi:Lar family restriction alleviation protein
MKPCPFCGRPEDLFGPLLTEGPEWHDGEKFTPRYFYVKCDNCGAQGGASPSREEATYRWNRRAAC